uniref:Photosystem II cytochrome b559 N-terminal domain-containing protein n=1 Tax=Oryza brachyantha TaxID=4533 RepID=J3LDL1_ORYBR
MWRKVGEMADTTGRIPLWLIGTVTGIPVIGLIGIFFRVHILDWVHLYSNRRDQIGNMKK